MKEEDILQIKSNLNQTLDERDSIDHQTHSKHHDYIDLLIKESNVRAVRYEAIRRQVIGWGIVTFLTAIGIFFYNAIIKMWPVN